MTTVQTAEETSKKVQLVEKPGVGFVFDLRVDCTSLIPLSDYSMRDGAIDAHTDQILMTKVVECHDAFVGLSYGRSYNRRLWLFRRHLVGGHPKCMEVDLVQKVPICFPVAISAKLDDYNCSSVERQLHIAIAHSDGITIFMGNMYQPFEQVFSFKPPYYNSKTVTSVVWKDHKMCEVRSESIWHENIHDFGSWQVDFRKRSRYFWTKPTWAAKKLSH